MDVFYNGNLNWITADYVWVLFLSLSLCLLIYPSLVWKSEELLTDYLFLHLVLLLSFIFFPIFLLTLLLPVCFRKLYASSLMVIKWMKIVFLVCIILSQYRCLGKLQADVFSSLIVYGLFYPIVRIKSSQVLFDIITYLN